MKFPVRWIILEIMPSNFNQLFRSIPCSRGVSGLEILPCTTISTSHVSETKQMSILLEWSSAWRAEAASGRARDRAFITMHWGIILGADGPSLSAKSTTVSVRWRPLLRSWLAFFRSCGARVGIQIHYHDQHDFHDISKERTLSVCLGYHPQA